ncbi:MAG: ParB/RepB/Spo0J family partition protein [Clostridia bacterium]|nr:ParB/RepB/Spo0J family partition protein [Clostridia bacterium]
MTSGKGLGKGLSALFGEDMTEDIAQVRGIKLRDIEPNPDQPRREFDPEALSELEESIRQNGVITPITVRRTGDNYVIIAGERRWRAARAAGLDEIPAYVLDVSEKEAYQFALVENLQRQDLNPIEEAMGYRKLIDDFGYSQDKAGEKVGHFYKLANADFHDKKGDAYGWMKLDYVKAFKDSNGYYLNLEEPVWY